MGAFCLYSTFAYFPDSTEITMASLGAFLRLFICAVISWQMVAVTVATCPILSRFPICQNDEVMAKTKGPDGCDRFECLPCPLPRIGCFPPQKFVPIPNSADPGKCPQFECKSCFSLRSAPRPKNCPFHAWKLEKDANNCYNIICTAEEEKPIIWS